MPVRMPEAVMLTGTYAFPLVASDCTTGGFYEAPTSGQNVNVSQPVTIEWDPTCSQHYRCGHIPLRPFDRNAVDTDVQERRFREGGIYSESRRDHLQSNITFDTCVFYRQTSTQSGGIKLLPWICSFRLLNLDPQPFLATLPAGPIWHAQYTPSNSSGSTDSIFSSNATDSGVTSG